jgi:hypothetical protein
MTACCGVSKISLINNVSGPRKLFQFDALLTHRPAASASHKEEKYSPGHDEIVVEVEAYEEKWRSGHENVPPASVVTAPIFT